MARCLLPRLFDMCKLLMPTTVLLMMLLPSHGQAEQPSCEESLLGTPSSIVVNQNSERVIETYLKAHLNETQSLFQRLIRDYPMQEYEYVLVGRSPTLLAAIFDVYKASYPQLRAWVLPVSLKNRNEVGLYELMDRFEQLFKEFRQQPEDDSRKLVFIDMVADGRTFKVLDRLLSLTDRVGEFAGFTADTLRAESVLKHWNLRSSYRVYPVSEAYSNEVGLLKNLAAFEPYPMDSSAYSTDPVVRGPIRPLFKLLIQVLLKTGEF